MGRKEWNQTKQFAHGELLWSLDPRRASSTIALKDISLTTGWILTKLGRNEPYMALFKNCSNGSGLLHIYICRSHRLKIDFQDENFENLLVWNHKA